jgi:hypothetical protein
VHHTIIFVWSWSMRTLRRKAQERAVSVAGAVRHVVALQENQPAFMTARLATVSCQNSFESRYIALVPLMRPSPLPRARQYAEPAALCSSPWTSRNVIDFIEKAHVPYAPCDSWRASHWRAVACSLAAPHDGRITAGAASRDKADKGPLVRSPVG